MTRPLPLPPASRALALLDRLRQHHNPGQALPTSVGALATLLCASALAPLFHGLWWWFAPVVLAIGVVVGLVALGRRLGLPPFAGVGLGLVGLLVLLTVLSTRAEAYAGILPTPSSLRRLGDLMASGRDDMSRLSAPVPHTPGLVVLTVIGVAFVALAVDLLVVTTNRPILAGLPLLGLFAVPAAVLPRGVGPLPFTVGVLGFLALLLLDGRAAMSRWGRLVSASTSRRGRARLTGPAGRVALGALVIAVVAPLVVPSLDGHGLVDRSQKTPTQTGGSGSSAGRDTPTATLFQRLHGDADRVILTVRPRSPVDHLRLREVALESFNGAAFGMPSLGGGNTGLTASGSVSDLVGPPEAVTTAPVEATITVDPGFQDSFLPVPPVPTKVTGLSNLWRYEQNTDTILAQRATTAGITYTVTSAEPAPTQAQKTAPGATPDVVAADAKLPHGVDARVRALAQRLTAGATSTFGKAEAIQNYLRGNEFHYDIDGAPRNPATALTDFLFTTRTGYCEQFAGAMAVLARAVGIPARIAVGFVGGTAADDGSIVIHGGDAHAWPEIWLPGTGWLAFEPTPRDDGAAPVPSYASGGEDDGVPSDVTAAEPSAAATSTPAASAAVTTTSPTAPGGQPAAGAAGSAGEGGDGTTAQTPQPKPVGHQLADLARSLSDGDASGPQLSIRASDPGAFRDVLLRETALDHFDGTGFEESWQPSTSDTPLATGLGDVPDGLASSALSATISVHPDFHETELPVFGVPSSIRGLRGDWLVHSSTSTVYGGAGTTAAGAVYTVRAEVPHPTEAQLREKGKVPVGLDEDLALPTGLDPRIRKLAAQLTAKATTSYDKVEALVAYLTGPEFHYDVRAAPGTVSDLLFGTRTGFCNHYATAMAVLARALGIPARVAMGYAWTPEVPQKDGTLLYKGGNRHAWTEVWLPGAGWYAVDATSPNAVAGGKPHLGMNTWKPDPGQKQVETGSSAASADFGPAPPPSAAARAARTAARVLIWLLVALAGLALLGSPAIARRVIRRRRLRAGVLAPGAAVGDGGGPRAAPDPAVVSARVRAGWAELLDLATDLGIPLRPSDSPRMVLARLNTYLAAGPEQADDARVAAATEALARLGWAEERVRFAPPGTPLGARAARVPADVETVVAALLTVAPRSRRLAAQVAPASVLRRLTRSGGYAAEERAWQRRAEQEASEAGAAGPADTAAGSGRAGPVRQG